MTRIRGSLQESKLKKGGNQPMPDKETMQRAQRDKRQGKATTTQAGEFVREEMHHVREGKHGARSPQQAVAIGLSKARRAGVKVPPPSSGQGSQKTTKSAQSAYKARGRKPSAKRSRAVRGALKREGSQAASHQSLSRQGRKAASQRTAAQRSASARKAARTKGSTGRSAAARKAARTRAW